MLCTYTGTDTRKYPDYRDTLTGRGLEVSPGGTYDIEAISGQALLPPGDGRWTIAVVREGVFEAPAPLPSIAPTSGVWIGTSRELTEDPPAPAAAPEPAAPVTPEEAGDSTAETES